MKFEHTKVMNFEAAFHGMRNPKNSWKLSDSDFSSTHCRIDDPNAHCEHCKYFAGDDQPCIPMIGPKDMALAQQLIRSGSEHRKFMRQIFVSVDITAPLFWWKEFDTYKVGTVANSTSTMHKIHSARITRDCFETGDYHPDLDLIDDIPLGVRVECFINDLEQLRQKYLQTKDKRYWKELIRWLPESWMQTRTVTLSYENLLAMCSKGQRRFHKLTEWSADFISWARSLPYAQEFIFLDELDEAKKELESKSAREKFIGEIKRAVTGDVSECDIKMDELLKVIEKYTIREVS